MLLSDLLNDVDIDSPNLNHPINHLTLDSREVKAGGLFIALNGTKRDGAEFIESAIANGASAILIEPRNNFNIKYSIPVISVPNLKQQITNIAAKFYDHPAKKLQLIGVTGTNGKTSCTHFIAQALTNLNVPCGIIGTLGNGFYGKLQDSVLTTPDAITIQALLAQFVKDGAQAVAMEVSSHSIDQHRVTNIPFAMGVFTNLTQDHLDYHGTMENYAAVKYHFLTQESVRQVIMNVDDNYGQNWQREIQLQKPTYDYAINHPSKIHAKVIATSLSGIRAQIKTPWGESEITLPLIGQFNLSNILATITALNLYGISFQDILTQLPNLNSVPGRMQLIRKENNPLVVVDYSHTPDSLAKALQALRAHTKGKLICVFGCGGDRDKSKRPKMAKIAELLADVVIVTSDNPRGENPESIISEILSGFHDSKSILIDVDRAKAILKSLQLAKSDDCILIAGKGAERYQQIGEKKIPFNDAEMVRNYFQ